jgi:hypothetical protein
MTAVGAPEPKAPADPAGGLAPTGGGGALPMTAITAAGGAATGA